MNEMIAFPWNGRIVEAPWPFTPVAKKLDSLASNKKFALESKCFFVDGGKIFLSREYSRNDKKQRIEVVKLMRGAYVSNEKGYWDNPEFGNFNPREVTLMGSLYLETFTLRRMSFEEAEHCSQGLFISSRDLLNALRNPERGNETFRFYEKEIEDDNGVVVFESFGNKWNVSNELAHPKYSESEISKSIERVLGSRDECISYGQKEDSFIAEKMRGIIDIIYADKG